MDINNQVRDQMNKIETSKQNTINNNNNKFKNLFYTKKYKEFMSKTLFIVCLFL